MTGRALARTLTVLAAAVSLAGAPAMAQPQYEIAINNGRVIDPETGLDAVRSIGVSDGRIVTVSKDPLEGSRTIDAKGLVVAPGFIDVHSHALMTPSAWTQAFDGVTTQLELENGIWPVAGTYDAFAKKGHPINYGFATGWHPIRLALLGKQSEDLVDEKTSQKVIDAMETGLEEGGIGVGLTVGHHTGTNRLEYYAAARLAKAHGLPTFTHIRYKNVHEPEGSIEGVTELIGIAAATGAHMHLCHVNSSTLRALPRALDMIAQAQKSGVNVTTEAYPWGAGSTTIRAPFLAPENLPLIDIEPSNITVLKTGEHPASDERLRELRKTDPYAMIVVQYFDEEEPEELALLKQAQHFPGALIVSDAVPYQVDGKYLTDPVWPLPANAQAHPRIAASFTKVIAREVRDSHEMTMLDAIGRATLLPARLLEEGVPQMRKKGRIQPGADADIVVFDLNGLENRATFSAPTLPTKGMRFVVVNGKILIDRGVLNRRIMPGHAVRAPVPK
ncbi:amidohydrolase family protein [Novosphingobium sp. BW1]|uniref:amidohydrolase family protein n=1 Tax=Novosphingobium sp. BW1 TaxID=2592621 RepID=UPI0011DE91C6|nr:amidohydrolase family protein [Novosphingobium sp. BW1]TYC94412.1 amidohydrolase family protein [Novosphingobium sp. BW1]